MYFRLINIEMSIYIQISNFGSGLYIFDAKNQSDYILTLHFGIYLFSLLNLYSLLFYLKVLSRVQELVLVNGQSNMESDLQSFSEEVATNGQKSKATYAKIEGVVDRMMELYEHADRNLRAGKSQSLVIEELNSQLKTLRPLKTVKEQFVNYYRKLSNLISRVQNGNKKSYSTYSRGNNEKENNKNSELSNIQRFNNFFDSFITEQKDKKALQKLMVEHFLREGQWQCAKVWGQNVNEIDPNNLFYQCYRLKDKIKSKQFQQAIAWCQKESLLEIRESPLQYELLKMHILSLVERGQAKLSLQYYVKKMSKYKPKYNDQIQKLIGHILCRYWKETIQTMPQLQVYCTKRYADLCITEQKCQKLSEQFVKVYLKQNKLSQFDVVKTVFECSKRVQDEYLRLMSVMWKSEGKNEKKSSNILPFSISLDKEYHYHSLFLCPVTKQAHPSGDKTVLLSCGHLISHVAYEKIQSRNRRRLKCPICQKEIHSQDSQWVQF